MAMGMAIGSIVSGVMSMSAASKQRKAARADMASAQVAWDKGEGYLGDMMGFALEGSIPGVSNGGSGGIGSARQGLDYAKGMAKKMEMLGNEYGEYAQDLWSGWEENWGGMRENLVDYYDNLDPNKYAISMKAGIGKQLDQQFEQFDQVAAQSGIYTSGMKLQAQKETAYMKAKDFAQADIAAEDKVMGMKTNFYSSIGAAERGEAMNAKQNSYNFQGSMLGQGASGVGSAYNTLVGSEDSYANRMMQASAANAGNSLANKRIGVAAYGKGVDYYNNQGNAYAKSAAGYGESAGKNSGSGFSSVVSGMGQAYAAYAASDVKLKKNIKKIGKQGKHNIYEWDWNDEGMRVAGGDPTTGVLAQEVLDLDPSAVAMQDGYLAVNYDALDFNEPTEEWKMF